MNAVSDGALVEFIDEIFDSESISFSKCYGYRNAYPANVKITVSNFDMPKQSDISELLDKCVLLNTYLSSYFLKCGYVGSFCIYYRVDCIKRTVIPEINDSQRLARGYFSQNQNTLYVNDLVLSNTDAGKKVERNTLLYSYSEYTEYNFVFTQLQKNLIKEADGK